MPTKILLADDSVTIQKVVELTFSDKNYEVTTVSDGESAIRKAREKQPDIILLDVIMPGMDGYEVCSILKQDSELKTVPVLLLTGTFEVFDTDRSHRVGADGYITKPFESQELIARVRRLVSQQQSETAPAEEDLDEDLLLPELERDEPSAIGGGAGGFEEEFPEFTFETESEQMDSEILFDFSMDSGSPQSGRGAALEKAPEPEPVGARAVPVKAPEAVNFDEDDEPTFDVPEFDLPDEDTLIIDHGSDSPWGPDDRDLTSNLAAITMPAPAAPKAAPAQRTAAPEPAPPPIERAPVRPVEEKQFVFQDASTPTARRDFPRGVEAAEMARVERVLTPRTEERPATDLQPVLDRLDRLESLLGKARSEPTDSAHLMERLDRLESLLERVSSAPSGAAPAGGGDDTVQRNLPQILDRITQSVNARLPELIDRAADRLSQKVAEQFIQRLGQSGLDTKEIVNSIAWQVVPDVAEMLVRRELEEIRRQV